MTNKSPFSQINQIGIVVRDLDRAIKHYESFGIGPFVSSKTSYLLREQWGKPVPSDVVLAKIAVAHLGEIQIELVQPIAHWTHCMEFMRKHGEGINHLGFRVDDIEKEEAKLVKRGGKIIYRSRFRRPDGSLGGATYFETDQVGGVLFELRGPFRGLDMTQG